MKQNGLPGTYTAMWLSHSNTVSFYDHMGHDYGRMRWDTGWVGWSLYSRKDDDTLLAIAAEYCRRHKKPCDDDCIVPTVLDFQANEKVLLERVPPAGWKNPEIRDQRLAEIV